MVNNPFGKSLGLKDITARGIVPIKPSVITETKSEPIVEKEQKEESEHAKILREHGGLESNIPVGHYYWTIRP